ncbi:MAG TPA: hypothetical protein VGP05_21335 [Pseudonocardia sp.]|jgi:hypothetical protein|nr:hypothetical protein [Pseudonocardia sp.]
MFERDSIRVIEPSDDAEAVNFEDSDLPILHWDGGWMLSYLNGDGNIRDHLVTGQIDDVELAVEMARAYVDRSPRTTAWPHSGSVVGDDGPVR